VTVVPSGETETIQKYRQVVLIVPSAWERMNRSGFAVWVVFPGQGPRRVMRYRRAVIGVGVLLLIALAGRVPGQIPVRTLPVTQPHAIRAAQPIEPGAGDLDPVPILGDGAPVRIPVFPGGPPVMPGGPGMMPGGPGMMPGDDDDCDVVDPPAPQVRIRVRVPSTAPAGKELEYRLIVENAGRGAAHHTAVRVTLPPSARLVRANPEPTTTDPEPRWQLGTLPGCGTKEITLVLVPTGEADVRLCARVSHEYGQCVQTRVGRRVPRPDDRIPVPMPMPGPEPGPGPGPRPPVGNPNLTLKVSSPTPATALLFDVVTFVLDVANTGTAQVRDVSLSLTPAEGLSFSNAMPAPTSDPDKPPFTWSLSTPLAPGQRRRIEVQLIAKKTGPLSVDVEVTDASGQKKTERGQVQIGEVKLELIKKGPARRLLSSTATYVLQVVNTGNVPATNVTVTDDLPDQIELVRASAGGKKVGTAVRWELGTLKPGERRPLQLEVRSKQAGTLKNRAVARTDRMENPVIAEAETVFENITGLTVEVDKSDPLLEVGKTGLYTVKVINQGEGDVENLGVTVTLPMELTLVEARGPTDPRKDAAAPGVVTFLPLGKLPGKQTATYQIRATAAMPGEVKVRVEVTHKALDKPLVIEEGTTLYR
jgi:uncharacterized repeat protein (TIGR01451 family)